MADNREAEVNALKTIYGPQALYVDSKTSNAGKMLVTTSRVGKVWELVLDYDDTDGEHAGGVFEAEAKHAAGHFKPESGLPLIVPGHKLIRAVVASTVDMLDLLNDKDPGTDTYKRMLGFDKVFFMKPVIPGNVVEIDAYLKGREGNSCNVDAEVTVGKKLHMIIEGLTIRDEPWPKSPVLLEDQIIEFAAQSAASGVLIDNPGRMPIFTGIGRTRFSGWNITPDSILIAIQTDSHTDGKRGFSCSSEVIDQDGRMVAEIEQMQAIIADPRLIKRMIGV